MKLLIVSLDAYSLFDTSTHFIFGGAELRSFLFADELSKIQGVEVTVVTRDHSVGNKKFGNVSVVAHPEKMGAGYWEKQKQIGTRIKNRLSKKKKRQDIFSFFDTIGPTHVLILGISPEAVECSNYCRRAELPFIFGCASDLDLSEKYLEENPVDTSGNAAGEYTGVIRNASLVLVQSQQQQMMLETRFGRKGMILLNPVSSVSSKGVSPVTTKCDVLWIGKTSGIKRPELFFELAKILPDLRFRMIMNCTDKKEWEKLVSEKPANLEVIESVPADKIEFYFMQTRLFVNTSLAEGFPNTFLQAGKHGIPVVSMIADPGHILSEKKAGILSGDDLYELKNSIVKLLEDETQYKECSENIRSYVKHNHEIGPLVKELYNAMKQLKDIAA